MGALPPHVLEEIRRARRHPSPTQFDYLHLRRLLDDLTAAFRRLDGPVEDVLDVYCGTRPYEELLPAGARCVGLDIDERYGAADIVSDEFLPFPDASFDLVMCTEAFHYVEEPKQGVAAIHRVLRPGGTVLIATPLVWEYDRTGFEHRYTGPALARLFEGWEDVRVVESGGRAVSWTLLTGLLVHSAEERLKARFPPLRFDQPLFATAYLVINGVGAILDAVERRFADSPLALPMNLLLTARRPSDERSAER